MQPPPRKVIERATELVRSIVDDKVVEKIRDETAPEVFDAARRFMQFDRRKRYIFLGRAMRPLFEAVWHLNLLHKRIPRKNLVYFVTPTIKTQRVTSNLVSLISRQLRARGVVSPSHSAYEIIDFRASYGRAHRSLERAVKKISARAVVTHADQSHRGVGNAIHILDDFGNHLWKDQEGKVGIMGPPWAFWKLRDETAFHQAMWVLLNSELYRLFLEHKRARAKI